MAWGKSTAAAAAFVVSALGLLRVLWDNRQPKRALSLTALLLLSLALSEVLGAALFYGGWLSDPTYSAYTPPLRWLLFGFSTFVIASGGYAALVAILGKRAAAPVVVTVAPVSPAAEPAAALLTSPVQLQPLGTAGTIPLHDLAGNVIGGVLPMPSGDEALK